MDHNEDRAGNACKILHVERSGCRWRAATCLLVSGYHVKKDKLPTKFAEKELRLLTQQEMRQFCVRQKIGYMEELSCGSVSQRQTTWSLGSATSGLGQKVAS
ncbi:hypothetical protein WJX82_006988 [Trebouxia sp. C0006]